MPGLSAPALFPWRYFALVFILSGPFWLVGESAGVELAPGLPISALAAFSPMAAAVIAIWREQGRNAAAALLLRTFDWRRIRPPIWYCPILLLMPATTAASYFALRALGGAMPEPQISLAAALSLFAFFFIAAAGEELGWTAYATDLLQRRWSALTTGLVLGAIWSVWHFLPLIQAHRTPDWIAWWCLGTVAQRVLMVWLYNNTQRSVFGAILFHATANVSWQLFPISGSHWDPRAMGAILSSAAVAVIVLWGAATLARFR
jgi:uncharacterized protein